MKLKAMAKLVVRDIDHPTLYFESESYTKSDTAIIWTEQT